MPTREPLDAACPIATAAAPVGGAASRRARRMRRQASRSADPTLRTERSERTKQARMIRRRRERSDGSLLSSTVTATVTLALAAATSSKSVKYPIVARPPARAGENCGSSATFASFVSQWSGTCSSSSLPSSEIGSEGDGSSIRADFERDVAFIGDGRRSASASSRFFRSVDRDGDGTIGAPELATFVRESIGFDTASEVEAEVGSVLEKLDFDLDDDIDKSDVFAYWTLLESLLAADEVAEWVVHAVQLPESVGKIFREHFVTGYDFPEMVENDGESLLTDLNIEKSSFRKKLVRHINARMLGVGTVPNPPSDVTHTVESCSAVNFSWTKSTARGFPVHSYRVQRRVVGSNEGAVRLNSSTSSGDAQDPTSSEVDGDGQAVSAASFASSLLSGSSSGSNFEWVTVYSGQENEFVDNSLGTGHNYVYRFQAWNSVGRSAWATVDITSSVKSRGCTADTSKDKSSAPSSPTFFPSIEGIPGEGSGKDFDVHLIGDGKRSASSSSRFFRSVDQDGDGTLKAQELASFVRESIGGANFDTPSEIEKEVDGVLQRLDKGHDHGLDKSDVFAYWGQLESLLTVEEVAEWVVYAVQLPESVGKIFTDNVVTGYDFPELVENDGEALSTDLKIEKSSFRKKLVRHIYARLLGVGTVPTSPAEIKHTVESCATASFSWSKSTAKGFPVHSYRVQRRGVFLHDDISHTNMSAGNLSSGKPACVSNVSNEKSDGKDKITVDDSQARSDNGSSVEWSPLGKPCPSSSDWVTVYWGGENEFVDNDLDTGHKYVYRFQAWNSVGRSAWVSVDISRSLKKQKCTTKRSRFVGLNGLFTPYSHNESDSPHLWTLGPWYLIKGSYIVANFVITFIRGILALAALAAAMMRFRRASASSTTSTNLDPMFPWLWRGVNTIALHVVGAEVIPKSFLGDKIILRRQASLHDKSVRSVGLNGYKPPASSDVATKDGAPKNRRAALQRTKSFSTGDLGVFDGVTTNKKMPRKGAAKLSKQNLDRNLHFVDEIVVGKPERCVSELSTPTEDRRDSKPTVITRETSLETSASESIAPDVEYEDDDTRCNSCRKRYKFAKRYKHHCARCLSTFCHKHGRTTHSNFTSCKVPGTCVCNVCLELEQFNQQKPRNPDSKGRFFTSAKVFCAK